MHRKYYTSGTNPTQLFVIYFLCIYCTPVLVRQFTPYKNALLSDGGKRHGNIAVSYSRTSTLNNHRQISNWISHLIHIGYYLVPEIRVFRLKCSNKPGCVPFLKCLLIALR